jgi:hypothetical protein
VCVCVCVCFLIEYISMPHYIVILHALRLNVHNMVTDLQVIYNMVTGLQFIYN